MTVGWQNRSPLPGGCEEEAAAVGPKAAAQRGARNARPESGSRGDRPCGQCDSKRWGGVDRKAAWGRLCQLPPAPHFTPEASGLPSPMCRTAAACSSPAKPEGTIRHPRREEGAGLIPQRVESQSQEPRLLVLSSPIFKKLQVELTYNVVLTTAVQLSGSVIRTHTRTRIYRLSRVLSQ